MSSITTGCTSITASAQRQARSGSTYASMPATHPRRHTPVLRHLDYEAVRGIDAFMRTTLTLDPDVVKLLEEVHRRRKPYK